MMCNALIAFSGTLDTDRSNEVGMSNASRVALRMRRLYTVMLRSDKTRNRINQTA